MALGGSAPESRPTAFVSASYAHREALGPALDAIAAACAQRGLRALIFVRAYAFAPEQQRAMLQTMQADLRTARLLIAEVTYKAIGVGIEVGYAAALGLPILAVRAAGAEPSTTVGGLATHTIVYADAPDLHARLVAVLARYAPRPAG